MFCRNCGAELLQNANVCIKCGVPAGAGKHFCPHCGSATDELAVVCVSCGAPLTQTKQTYYGANGVAVQRKSKLVAGLLGVLVGYFGVHNFYLGYTARGVAQILLTTVGSLLCGIGPVISFIWGLIDGIQILMGTITTDAAGVPFTD
ncbi:MAG: TM2 domain-containing protein [Hydrogenoanaerobacterium sp.]